LPPQNGPPAATDHLGPRPGPSGRRTSTKGPPGGPFVTRYPGRGNGASFRPRNVLPADLS
jgi:hypothetical protein